MKILIIEDEEKLAKYLKHGLKNEGFVCDVVLNGTKGKEYILMNQDAIDLIILDVMLPDIDGVTLCHDLREEGVTIPILMLTARDATNDKIAGLDTGADDYITKPFSFGEVVSRIKTLLRRPRTSLPVELHVGKLRLNTVTRNVVYGQKKIFLSLKEFMLLEYFMRHPNQVLTREQCIDSAWDINFDSFSNIVDVHIKNLRKKLIASGHEELLETIRGVGYRLKG